MSNNISEAKTHEGERVQNLNREYYFRIGVSIWQSAFDALTISVGTQYSMNLMDLPQEEMWYLMSMHYLSTYDDTRWNEDRKRLVEIPRQKEIIALLQKFRLIISRENFLNRLYGRDGERKKTGDRFRVGWKVDSKNSTLSTSRFDLDEVNFNFWQNTERGKSKKVIVVTGPEIFMWEMIIDLYQKGFRNFVVPQSSMIDSFSVNNSDDHFGSKIPKEFYGSRFSDAMKEFLPNIKVSTFLKKKPDFLICAEVNWLVKFHPGNFMKHRVPFCFLLIHHKSFTLSEVYHKGNFFEFEKYVRDEKNRSLFNLRPNYRLFGEEIYKYPNLLNVGTQTKKIAEMVNDFFSNVSSENVSAVSTISVKTSQKEKELI